MKNILIATRNKDKFRIISKLLSTKLFKGYNFYSLNELDDKIIDKEEIGDVLNRSLQKAQNVYENINKNEFDFIIGIDDGIKIRGSIIENVKDYIKPIINDEYLHKNEIVYIVRAYTFIDKKGNIKSILTEIPFKYKKIEDNFTIENNSYPLSYVLMPIDSNKTVIEQSDDESNDYYLKYSDNKFEEVKTFFYDK